MKQIKTKTKQIKNKKTKKQNIFHNKTPKTLKKLMNLQAHVKFYCWFSHDFAKIQTEKLSFLRRFYFHDALEQLKTNFHTNFRFERVLGFVIEYA